MKRVLTLILAVALVLAACAPINEPSFTPVPTAEATEAPTETPTEAPTEAPTPAPTSAPAEVPDFSALIPRTGNLTGGPIFPEPFKYLVLQGDGSLHYVYDNMGELLYSFAAPVYEDGGSSWGLFTEDGVCCWRRLSDGSEVTPFTLFGNLAITTGYADGPDPSDPWEGSYGYISLLRDANLENPVEFEKGELRMGKLGGILELKDGYLLIERDYYSVRKFLWGEDCEDDQKLTLLDKNFKKVRTVDDSALGYVSGTLGGKYLLVWRDRDPDEYYHVSYCVYDLDGNPLLEDVEICYTAGYSHFTMDDEMWEAGLILAEYVKGADGNYYDKELHRVSEDELPYPSVMEKIGGGRKYFNSFFDTGEDGISVYSNGVFSGIVDKDGNWVFRIWSPKFAEDTIPDYGGAIGNYWPDNWD